MRVATDPSWVEKLYLGNLENIRKITPDDSFEVVEVPYDSPY
jgi:hypothetical protein